MEPTAPSVVIDKEKCTECKKCEADCMVTQYLGFPSMEEVPRASCNFCGHCIAACEFDAITHFALDRKALAPVGELPTPEQMLNLIRMRRSLRTYQKQPVKREDMDKLLEAVRYSMTGGNVQEVNVVIVESENKIKSVADAVMDFTEQMAAMVNDPAQSSVLEERFGEEGAERAKAIYKYPHLQKEARNNGHNYATYDAPAIILLTGPTDHFASQVDSALAAQAIALLAPTLGMAVCFNGILVSAVAAGFPPLLEALKDAVPDNESVFAALMLGYELSRYPFVPPREERKVVFI